jgi:3-phenylpropionate/cinnamic acid dioxygenase small subunit
MSGPVDREVRSEVADVLVRYATGIDRRDWDLFRSCFTDDCDIEYPGIGVWHSAEEITGWMRDVHEPCGHTLHRISNVAVTEGTRGVTARSYVDAIVMFAGNRTGTRAAGSYDDELVPTGDGWKLARRRFTVVLLEWIPEGTNLDLGPG